jgi:hypothetical protein
LGYLMVSGLMLITGVLAAKKASDDLDAFRPGPLRLADIVVLLISLLVVVIIDLALAPYFEAGPVASACRPPACILIPIY